MSDLFPSLRPGRRGAVGFAETGQLSKETTDILEALGLSSEVGVNVEALEENSELRELASLEGRALALSELWFRHASQVKKASPAGSLASYLRAADLALEALLDDGCASAFNSQCALLSSTYAAATRETVEALRENDWRPPDIGQTRYSLMVKGDNGPLFLSDWALTFRDADSGNISPNLLSQRPGVGVTAAGCRVFNLTKDDVGVCSPLTFVLSFSPLTSRDRTEAVLSVYDGYQREVVALRGRDLPLAADFGAANALLLLPEPEQRDSKLEQERATPALSCLSVPSASTTSVIAVGATSAIQRYRDAIGDLIADPAVRSRFSFCFFRSNGSDAVDLSIDLHEVISPGTIPSGAGSVVLLSLDEATRAMIPKAAKNLRAGSSRLKVVGAISVVPKGTPQNDIARLKRTLSARNIPFVAVTEEPGPSAVALGRTARASLRAALVGLPQPRSSQSSAAPAAADPTDLQLSSVF
jgi:hypothetical protein